MPRIPQSDLPGGNDEETRNIFSWLNVTQVARAGSIPAKQWARVPVGIAATNIDFVTRDVTDENGNFTTVADYDILAFLVPESSEEKYGSTPVIKVRTVAFGSIPAEVSLQLRQRRDPADLPVGLHLRPSFTTNFTLARDIYPPTSLKESVDVAVVGIKVDGVQVPLGTTCSTGPTADLDVASEPIVVDRAAGETFDQDRGFSGIEGGTLEGTLDIPAFSGCTTATGDDLSPLLTSAVSGPDNPVTIKIGILGCYSGFDDETGAPLPARPGTAIADAGCPPDSSETVEGIPSPLPFPDYAPGEQPTP